jgi:hypothetical protein
LTSDALLTTLHPLLENVNGVIIRIHNFFLQMGGIWPSILGEKLWQNSRTRLGFELAVPVCSRLNTHIHNLEKL